jgi:hypothetical protein
MTVAETLRRLEETATASIRVAFADTVVPGPAEVRNDHCPECQETAGRFAGRRWEEITVDTLLLYPKPSIGLLTPGAFRYYLPALMLRCIEAHRALDVLPDAVVAAISPPRAKATSRVEEELRDFTAAQVVAILAFLRVCEMREKLESGASEETLEWTPVDKPLARAIRYWTARAESAGE